MLAESKDEVEEVGEEFGGVMGEAGRDQVGNAL